MDYHMELCAHVLVKMIEFLEIDGVIALLPAMRSARALVVGSFMLHCVETYVQYETHRMKGQNKPWNPTHIDLFIEDKYFETFQSEFPHTLFEQNSDGTTYRCNDLALPLFVTKTPGCAVSHLLTFDFEILYLGCRFHDCWIVVAPLRTFEQIWFQVLWRHAILDRSASTTVERREKYAARGYFITEK